MSDIEELERRLTSALDRIGAGLGRIGGEDAQGLADELAAEREANAQLEERVRAIKEKQETTVASLQEQVTDLQGEIDRLREALTGTDADLQRVRSVNAELRASNAALRSANAEGLADADLVNGALQTELSSLRELNAANRAEIDRALAALEPMLEEAGHA